VVYLTCVSKNHNFAREHLLTTHALFGYNQLSSIWQHFFFHFLEDLRSILDGCYYRTNLTWDAYGKIVLNYSYLKPLHYFDSKLSWNVLWMVHYQMSIFLYGFEIRKQSASSNKFPTMDPVSQPFWISDLHKRQIFSKVKFKEYSNQASFRMV
jgi:hypothetical protein